MWITASLRTSPRRPTWQTVMSMRFIVHAANTTPSSASLLANHAPIACRFSERTSTLIRNVSRGTDRLSFTSPHTLADQTSPTGSNEHDGSTSHRPVGRIVCNVSACWHRARRSPRKVDQIACCRRSPVFCQPLRCVCRFPLVFLDSPSSRPPEELGADSRAICRRSANDWRPAWFPTLHCIRLTLTSRTRAWSHVLGARYPRMPTAIAMPTFEAHCCNHAIRSFLDVGRAPRLCRSTENWHFGQIQPSGIVSPQSSSWKISQ